MTTFHIDDSTGILDINKETTINENLNVRGSVNGNVLKFTSSLNEASAISLITDAGSSETINITSKKGTTASSVSIDSELGGIAIGPTITNGKTIIIGNSGNTELKLTNGNASNSISINSTSGGIEIGTTLSDGKSLKLGKENHTQMIFTPNNGSNSHEKISLINTAGTDTDAIKIQSVAGGIDIDSSNAVAIDCGGTLSLESTNSDINVGATLSDGQSLSLGKASRTQMVFTPYSSSLSNEKISLINTGGTANDAIKIQSVDGGIDIDAGTGGITIDTTGNLDIGAETTINDNLNIMGNLELKSGNLNIDSGNLTLDVLK